MEKYYQILGLEEDATLEEVEKKYSELLKEFDPEKQSDDDLKEFFKSEQEKVKEAYLEISLSFSNTKEEKVKPKKVDEFEKEIKEDSSDDILICYQTLKLSEDATLAEINNKYNLLLDEFNPGHQSDELRDFFEGEQAKVKEAYNTIVKSLSEKEPEEQIDILNEDKIHDLGTYQNNDDVKYCKFCGYMQYVTNLECINCNKSFIYSSKKNSVKTASKKNSVKTGEVKIMFSAPFSFKGRIRRIEYFLSLLIFCFSFYLLIEIRDEFRLYNYWYSVFCLPFAWFILSQTAKRLQDCWMSGWLLLIPYVNILLMIIVIFKPGTVGDNKYGSNPKGLNYN